MVSERNRIVREEAWRSAAWLALSFLGWSLIITSTDRISATAVTALGLPLFTAAFLTVLMIGIRVQTGLEFTASTGDGQLLKLVGGGAIGGFVFLYLVFVRGSSPWWLVAYTGALIGGVLVWGRNL